MTLDMFLRAGLTICNIPLVTQNLAFGAERIDFQIFSTGNRAHFFEEFPKKEVGHQAKFLS